MHEQFWLLREHVQLVDAFKKFNIHAQRTWNCVNPLEGGQAGLYKRQAWELNHQYLLVKVNYFSSVWLNIKLDNLTVKSL
jgi:hypothetical protein